MRIYKITTDYYGDFRNSLLSNGTNVNMKGQGPLQSLFTNTKLLDESPIFLNIFLFQIIKQASSLPDKLQQALSGVMILFVFLEMVVKVVNAVRQKSYLHF